MQFTTPGGIAFQIPDDWWRFADMDRFRVPAGGGFYPYAQAPSLEVVPIEQIEPPTRDTGVELFKKYKLLPVLFAFQSPECALPAVKVQRLAAGPYRFKVQNGLHRYYGSVAAGYRQLPVVVIEPFDFEKR